MLIDKCESTWVSVTTNSSNILIGCLYLPPSVAQTSIIKLSELFHMAALLPFDSMLIAGDFNLPSMASVSDNSTLYLKRSLSTLGWMQHIHSPTRGNNTLDLLFSLNLPVVDASVGPLFPGSDHKVISAHFNFFSNTVITTTTRLIRPYRLIDWATFKHLLSSLNWDDCLIATNVDSALSPFYQNMNYLLDIVAPYTNNNLTKCKTPTQFKPKVTLQLERIKRKLATSLDPTYLKKLHHMIDLCTSQSRSISLNEERSALHSTNKVEALSELLRKRSSRRQECPTAIKNSLGEVITDLATISNMFNKHFTSTLTVDLLPLPVTHLLTDTNELDIVHFNIDKIRSTISSLKVSTYSGPDSTPSVLYKFGGELIPIILQHIFALSMTSGTYPLDWKYSFIKPRHKTGAKHDLSNYRPIHHTCILSRIMEKIIKKDLLQHLMDRTLVDASQHGFLNQKSCATCMTSFLDRATHNLDNGNSLLLLYLDFHKAFDRVPHLKSYILIKK